LNGSAEWEASFAEGGGGRIATGLNLAILEGGNTVSGVKESPNGSLPNVTSLADEGPNGSDGVMLCI
jgi:hypothetical protein